MFSVFSACKRIEVKSINAGTKTTNARHKKDRQQILVAITYSLSDRCNLEIIRR